MQLRKYRAMSLLLSLLLALGLLGAMPSLAFGEEGEGTPVGAAGGSAIDPMATPPDASDICMILAVPDNIGYATLADALAAAASGDTIVLLQDITEATVIDVSFPLTIDLGSFNLDLDGEYISVDSTGDLTISNGGTLSTIQIYVSGGKLTATADIIISHPSASDVIFIDSAGEVTITGNVIGEINAYDPGTTVIVNGNITVSGLNAHCVSTRDGQITVNGNINVSGSGCRGAQAEDDGQITVNGNITASGTDAFGAASFSGGQVYVNGNIAASGTDAVGVVGFTGALVTVNGTITAPTYIEFRDTLVVVQKTAADHEPTSSKAGFLEYTDGVSFVWVAEVIAPVQPATGNIPATGDAAGIIAVAILLALAALGTTSILFSRRLRRTQ